jgi:Tol biopolymer transport system component
MSRTMQFPAVAHIVADLDDLEVTARRGRGHSAVGRMVSALRRLMARHHAYSRAVLVALLAFILACSDSDGAVTSPRVPIARMGITPTTVLLERGATRQVTAVAFDAAGNALDGRTVQWSTDAPAVATVSASGLVRAVAPGYALITATAEGKSASIAVTVPTTVPVVEYDLVYERRPFNGGGDIRRVSLATGASTTMPLVLTIPGTFVRDAAPSPDGTQIAFTIAWYPAGSSTLDGDIYVANIDGSGLRRLTTAEEMDEQPAWSPDGTRIAFRSKRSGDWDIWAMGANGTGQVNLMLNVLPAASTESTPTWSPDGARILYSSDIDTYAYAKLWTMRPDGSDKRRVLPLAGTVTDIDVEASWSPDGSKIAFRRVDGRTTGSDIMVATVATGEVARVALDAAQVSPAWSPDGTRIAFTSSHDGLLAHVFTMKPDGTDISRHTTGSDANTSPRWLRVVTPAAGAVAR